MSIRSYKKKPGRWVIDYYPQGRKGKKVLKVFVGSEADAQTLELELRRQYQIPLSVNPKTKDVLPDWYKEYEINHLPSTFQDVKRAFKHLTPHFGNYQFTQLAPTLIEGYKAKRLGDKAKQRTINRELVYFNVFLNWAVERNHCNPLPFRIKKFSRVKTPKPRIPHPTEINKLFRNIEPKYKVLALLLYEGGLRRSEALGLKAEDVQLKNGVLLVKGKGEKERTVPIATDHLKKELQKTVRKAVTGPLFINPGTGKPYTPTAIRKALNRAAVKAKLNMKIYPHLLRHSYGTHALVSGMGLRTVQEVMGHSSSKTTEGYTHLAGEFLKEETKKFGHYIGSHKKGKKP